MISSTAHMRELFELAAAVSTTRMPILIEGERGTGKTSLAREIHRHSGVKGPFVVARLDPGEEWTDSQERGWLRDAAGGTLFLEEIARVPFRRIRAILGTFDAPSDGLSCDAIGPALSQGVRIVAATRVDLRGAGREGRRRESLARRLAWIPLRLPTLAERRDDVALLAEHFLARFAGRSRRAPVGLSALARDALLARSYPGNVRELELAMLHALRRCPDGAILPAHLPTSQLEHARRSGDAA